jgi:hypothetical protein
MITKENLAIDEDYMSLKVKELKDMDYYGNTPGERLNQNIPNGSGVYILTDENMNVLYIGKAQKLRNRITAHTSFGCTQNSWVDKKRIKRIYVIVCPERINDIVEMTYQYFIDSEFNNHGHCTINNLRQSYNTEGEYSHE